IVASCVVLTCVFLVRNAWRCFPCRCGGDRIGETSRPLRVGNHNRGSANNNLEGSCFVGADRFTVGQTPKVRFGSACDPNRLLRGFSWILVVVFSLRACKSFNDILTIAPKTGASSRPQQGDEADIPTFSPMAVSAAVSAEEPQKTE
ncbi:unnamed protein product, partial [Scytosiphon promiscuus]